MLKILHSGCYSPGQLHARWTTSSRKIIPEVEAAIEIAWQKALAVPGVKLFDGKICRFENMQPANGNLTIELSETSYRIVLGTNFANPYFEATFGDAVMGNSLGVSCGLITSDRYMMMGRRNATVAYYPHRVHPFAGSLEVTPEVDLFGNVKRELREELGLVESDLSDLFCHGIAKDSTLRHPELIFSTQTRFTHHKIETMLDQAEHDAVWQSRFEPEPIAEVLKNPSLLTPIARAVLIMTGRHYFGEDWFKLVSHHVD